jgi:kynureninase
MSLDLRPGSPALRAGYSRFLADPSRVLLTGHSHQAWPDCVRDAMTLAFDDAARLVDDKWSLVSELTVDVASRALRRLGLDPRDLDAPSERLVFGQSTHELVFRLLSCFPLDARTHVVTTTGEFHSLHRQLERLEEAGVRVTWVPAEPRQTLGARLAEATAASVTLVAASAVLFEDATVVTDLGLAVSRAHELGVPFLVDAYHAFNVVPLELGPHASSAFVTAGGYKYAQLGEGVCFLRVPAPRSGAPALRPVYTGWFADFQGLSSPRATGSARRPVGYGPGASGLAGSTFDPVGLYRARAALAHQDALGLDVPTLRAISLEQTGRIVESLDRAGLGSLVATPRDASRRGPFVSVRAGGPEHGDAALGDRARAACARLRERKVLVDSRGPFVRLGPAPYLTHDELDRGVRELASALTELG